MGRTLEVRVIGDVRDVQRKLGAAADATSSFGSKAAKAGALLKTLAVASAGVGAALTGFAIKSAVDFESSFAGIRKTVDATEAEFDALAKGIRKMAKEIPVNVNELNKIGEAAGQLGIKKKNILTFTRTIADLGVTTNLASDEAATSLARLANITQMPQKNFKRLGSTIVALGNNLATTEQEIVAFGLRVAGAGKQIGLTEPQILAIGAALSSVGIEAEAGGTAISTTMVKIAAAVNKGGEDLAGFARVAGLSGGEFAKTFKTDAAGAIVAFVEGLGTIKRDGGDVFGTLDKLSLGNIRVRDALLRASGAGDLLRRSLTIANRAWLENTALTKEAEQRYNTTASQFRLLRNRLTDIGIALGTHLLPPINAAIRRFVRLIEVVESAKGLRAKIQVVFTSVKNALSDLLFGETKRIRLPLGDYVEIKTEGLIVKTKDAILGAFRTAIQGRTETVALPGGDYVTIHHEGIAQKFAAALNAVNWDSVAQAVAQSIGGAMDRVDWRATGERAGTGLRNAIDAEGARMEPEARSWGARVAAGIRGGVESGLSTVPQLAMPFRVLGDDVLSSLKRLSNLTLGFLDGLTRDTILRSNRIIPAVIGAFSRLPDLVEAVFNRVRSAIARVDWVTAATPLPIRVIQAIVERLRDLPSQVLGPFKRAAQAVRGMAGTFFAYAFRLGSAVVSGVVAGLGGLAARVGAKIAGGIRAAIDWAKDNVGSTAAEYASRKLGAPMGEGVIRGWVMGTAALPEKMKESLRNAIEAARATVDASRERLGAAFDGLASRILRAFDAETAMFRTRSERIIDEIAQRREMEDLLARQAEAQARLNQLVAEGASAGDVAGAQRDLARAGEDIELVKLREKAAAERLQYESRREEQRLFLEERLKALTEHFQKEGATTRQALAAITKLMRRFGVDFATAGGEVGRAFVRGLKAAIREAAGQAGALQATLEKVADSVKVPGRAHGGPVMAGRPYVVGELGPELFVPGRSGRVVPTMMGAAGSRPIVIRNVIELDGRVVAENTRTHKSRYERLNGPGKW